MKPRIICIVGYSGCGKTTLVKFIKDELGVPYLVSYTTRPMRKGETDGIDHYFVSQSAMPPMKEMLAYTNFGGHHYWTNINDVPKTGAITYVIDEYGLKNLKKNYSDRFDIKAILIKRSYAKLVKEFGPARLLRDLQRESIDEKEYDAAINNNGSLQDFLDKARQTIITMID